MLVLRVQVFKLLQEVHVVHLQVWKGKGKPTPPITTFLSEALTESRSAEREASEAGHAGKEAAGTRAWRTSEDVSLH